jgi:phosphohistidine phosphatase
MLIYLVRHASAFGRDDTRWPDDSTRPLTPGGQRKFERAARGVRQLMAAPQSVLSSPYRRAWQTAEVLAKYARWPAPAPAEGLAADSSARRMVTVLEEHASEPSVALVGHEPIMGELLSLLLTGEEVGMAAPFKKGGIACVEIESDLAPGSARLLWMAPPKLLRAAADC